MKKANNATMGVDPIYFSNELMLDLFLDWSNSNPELFDKKYPQLSRSMKKNIDSHPEMVAALTEKLPELFPKWLEQADRLIGSPRIRSLQRIINILETLLNNRSENEIIEHSRKKMESIAREYLEIVRGIMMPAHQSRMVVGFKIGSPPA